LGCLNDVTVEILFMPSIEGLAAEVGRSAVSATHHLTFLYCQIDLASPRITLHSIEFRVDRLFQNLGQNIVAARRTGRAALGRLFRLDDVRDGPKRRIGSPAAKHTP